VIDWGFRRDHSDPNKGSKYDLVGQATLLADENQTEPVERAIRSQLFRFALHCPRITNLDFARNFDGYNANYGEEFLRVTAALIYDFRWQHSKSAKFSRLPLDSKNARWLFNTISKSPGSDAVKSALHLNNRGLRPLIDGSSTDEITIFWRKQLNKTKTSAKIIEGYLTAGEALPRGGRPPFGFSTMIEALKEGQFLNKSDRTIDSYYTEVESAAVLHYLMYNSGISDYFGPTYPINKDFVIACIARRIKFIDARKIFIANNIVAAYLNRYFGFKFTIFPVRYSHDHYLAKDFKKDPALAERIRSISGRTT
jgi:hypothetical protein